MVQALGFAAFHRKDDVLIVAVTRVFVLAVGAR
jgi:hypothetical protein